MRATWASISLVIERVFYCSPSLLFCWISLSQGVFVYLLDLTEPAAASQRFWADSAGRHAGDGHRTAGGSATGQGQDRPGAALSTNNKNTAYWRGWE